MEKYRRKPVVIEAVQWFKMGDHPEVKKYPHIKGYGYVDTPAGGALVAPGYWIMESEESSLPYFPISPDEFVEHYEKVKEE